MGGATPEQFWGRGRAGRAPVGAYSEVTRALLRRFLGAAASPGRFPCKGWSRFTPGLLRGYSDFTPRQLRPSSAAVSALLQPYSTTTQPLAALLLLSVTPELLSPPSLPPAPRGGSYSELSQHLRRGRSGLGSYTDFTPELLTVRAGSLLRAYSAPRDVAPLLRAYSGLPPGGPYSELTQHFQTGLTPDLLTRGPSSGACSAPPFVLFSVLGRCSRLTPRFLRLVRSSPPSLRAYSALTRRFHGTPALAPPLLRGYSALAHRLLSPRSEVTPPSPFIASLPGLLLLRALLRRYPTLGLPRLTQRLLRPY